MQKPKLLLLFFLTFLAASSNIISMAREKPDTTSVGDSSSDNECCVCFYDKTGKEFTLICNHQICTVCAAKFLKKIDATCPLCRGEFREKKEPAKLGDIDRRTVYNNHDSRYDYEYYDDHYESRYPASNNAGSNRNYVKKNLNYAEIAKYVFIGCALTGYGVYRFFIKKKTTNTTPEDKVKEGSPSWLSKKFASVKQSIKEKVQSTSKSDVLVPAIVGTGLFALLTKQRVNLSLPIQDYAYNKLGNKRYCDIEDSFYGNIFSRAILNEFQNGRAINAGLSVTGGLLAGYCYKLLDGSSSKAKKQPIARIKK